MDLMLIVGAKGLAKEVLEIFHQRNELENLYFYDDISTDIPEKLFGIFPVIREMTEVMELFKTDNRFTIGTGGPQLRFQFSSTFKEAGGQLVSVISPLAAIGHYGTVIGSGSILMAGSVITNNVTIGEGCLVNPNCTISHDSRLGDFVEVSPGVQITGHCMIGNYCTIGTNATILPKIKIGNEVTIGAGAVVTRDVADRVTVVGVPAKVIRKG
jgi:sugar O-acyltransferase (sialic acid O-acetyltransferase NeuD family)